jgi:dihydroorotate dehydrogenase electron transfer subunit
MNTPYVTPILKSTDEAQDIKTVTFQYPGKIEPGQFFMIWIPGVDEIPMSVSLIQDKVKGITFRRIGEATSALYNLKKGDAIGVRGPYGHGFELRGRNLLFVGGGTGIAMLAPMVERARKKKRHVTVILGVKTNKELLFEQRLKRTGAAVFVSTDDGTKGFEGFASDFARDLLREEPFDSLYTCGPEPMMKAVFIHSNKIPFQASLERFMKCSLGLCGQCCIGKGLRVCVDGPVFDRTTLNHVDDFGVFKRDAAGRKIFF